MSAKTHLKTWIKLKNFKSVKVTVQFERFFRLMEHISVIP